MFSIFKRIIAKPNVAIDLGTANTRIYGCEQGIIAEEPSLVRNTRQNSNGQNSDAYIRYLNSRLISSPLRGGVIVDFKTAIALLKPLLKRARKGLRRPVSLASAPTDASEEERRLLVEAILHAGSSNVAIIPEPWAAAIGAGIDVTLPHAQLVIDVGEGVTDMAVIRNGHLIYTAAVRSACWDLHKSVRTAILSRHKVCPYAEEVERLTHEMDSSLGLQTPSHKSITVNGIAIARRCEASVEVSNREVIGAMEPVMFRILKTIEKTVQGLPESIYWELQKSGICLTGGGSCIKGIDRLIASRTHLDVRIAHDPAHAVINGAIQTLQDWKEKEAWWENIVWPTPLFA